MQGRNVALITIIMFSAILLAASGTVALGQTSFGSVNGTVTDATDGVIPGAAVTLLNQSTNIRMEATTNESGFYRIVNVRPGFYRGHQPVPGEPE